MSRHFVSAARSFLLTALPISFVGIHILAAFLGLYTSAPRVTILQPSQDAAGGEGLIEVRADDGPLGSGVRSVEYQLGSTSGTWTPLAWDERSMTYKGTWKATAEADGELRLYVRATDHTGNPRVVHTPVAPTPAPAVLTRAMEPDFPGIRASGASR